LFVSLIFAALVAKDKQEYKRLKQEYEDNARKQKIEDIATVERLSKIHLDIDTEYNAKLAERHNYCLVMNHIRRQAKVFLADNDSNSLCPIYEKSLLNTAGSLEKKCPTFIQKFIHDDLSTHDQYLNSNSLGKLLIIREVFSTYIYLQWSLGAYQSLRKKSTSITQLTVLV
jgi:hypothetical protein